MKYQSFYLSLLKEELVERQKKNPSYSLRSYADFLGIHPGTLSSVFNGKRTLPLTSADKITLRLGLSPKEKMDFLKSLATEKAKFKYLTQEEKEKQVYLDENNFKIIAQYEHYAIVTLMDVKDFQSNPIWIAKRLGLSLNRVEMALERLISAGLVIKDEAGNFKKTFSKLGTTIDILSPALQKAHLEDLDIAKEKLGRVDVHKRNYSSTTIAVNPAKMEKAKMVIYEFRQKMRALMEQGDRSEVYQLCVQLFPLTELEEL